MSVFTGHSVRSAASSKARAKGATIAEILKCGNGSKESTWQRFYNKSVSGEPTKVQEYLLKGRNGPTTVIEGRSDHRCTRKS